VAIVEGAGTSFEFEDEQLQDLTWATVATGLRTSLTVRCPPPLPPLATPCHHPLPPLATPCHPLPPLATTPCHPLPATPLSFVLPNPPIVPSTAGF
jgi:hypothetical protein